MIDGTHERQLRAVDVVTAATPGAEAPEAGLLHDDYAHPQWRSTPTSINGPELWNRSPDGIGGLRIAGVQEVERRWPTRFSPIVRREWVDAEHRAILHGHLPDPAGVHGMFRPVSSDELVEAAERLSLQARDRLSLSSFPLVAALADGTAGWYLTLPVERTGDETVRALTSSVPAGLQMWWDHTLPAARLLVSPGRVLELWRTGQKLGTVAL